MIQTSEQDNDIILSCIQPTGEMHFGNYFGAIKNWVTLQEKNTCIFGVVDYHAMTMPYNPKELHSSTADMIIDLLACGVDPKKAILFIQSLVPEHAELCWILSCFCSYGELKRMTQFKDKSTDEKTKVNGNIVSTGLFTYPVLQAADILIYKATYVPVGKDQEQHLELSRNIAIRFNNYHREYFKVPQALFTETPKLRSLADPSKKMSKSLGTNHVIGLFEDETSIRKKVKNAITDLGAITDKMSPGVANLFELLKASGRVSEYNSLTNDYRTGKLKYSALKENVANGLIELSKQFISRKLELTSNKKLIEEQVYDMSAKARQIAQKTMSEVRLMVGLPKIK